MSTDPTTWIYCSDNPRPMNPQAATSACRYCGALCIYVAGKWYHMEDWLKISRGEVEEDE